MVWEQRGLGRLAAWPARAGGIGPAMMLDAMPLLSGFASQAVL